MPELHRWDVELECRGYYGFGGGYALSQGFTYKDRAVYCDVCTSRESCWEEHRKRTAEIIPALTEEFERRSEEMEGPELMEWWWKEFHNADPYTVILVGNMEDGSCVGAGLPPKDRGPYTLTWPLEPRRHYDG